MDRDGSSTAEEDDAPTIMVSQASDLLKNVQRSNGPPRPSTMPPSRGSDTRIKNAPVVPVPYTDLVEDDHTTVLEPERLDDLKTSMGRKSPLLPPKGPPTIALGALPLPKIVTDQDKTTVFQADPTEAPPRHDETTRRPFISRPAPRMPQLVEAEATLPLPVTEVNRAPPPVPQATVFALGMVVGFLIAVALCLSLLLYLVSTGRITVAAQPPIPTQSGTSIMTSPHEKYL